MKVSLKSLDFQLPKESLSIGGWLPSLSMIKGKNINEAKDSINANSTGNSQPNRYTHYDVFFG